MAYRSDFDEFVKTNGLRQKDLANLLHVSETFISRLTCGIAKCPADKLNMLEELAKTERWNMTMFHREVQQKGGVINNIGVIAGGQNAGHDNVLNSDEGDSTLVVTLLKQIDRKDEQIGDLLNRLSSFTEKLITIQEASIESNRKVMNLLERLTENQKN